MVITTRSNARAENTEHSSYLETPTRPIRVYTPATPKRPRGKYSRRINASASTIVINLSYNGDFTSNNEDDSVDADDISSISNSSSNDSSGFQILFGPVFGNNVFANGNVVRHINFGEVSQSNILDNETDISSIEGNDDDANDIDISSSVLDDSSNNVDEDSTEIV